MSKRSPEEILKGIEDSEVDDEIERVLAMSPEQRRRELEASDVDVNALHAKADAFHAQIHRAGAGPPLAKAGALPMRHARTPWAISLIAAALGALLLVVARGGDDRVGSHKAAAALRDEAYTECDARRWRECEQKLDAAKVVDPTGESEPRVVAARRAVRDGLGR